MRESKSTPASKKRESASTKQVGGESTTSKVFATITAYIQQRAATTGSTDPALPMLLDLIQKLEARNRELESSVQSLSELSLQLKAALDEAKLGFRRHVRQRVPDSELQAALAFAAPNVAAPDEQSSRTPESTQEQTSVSDSPSSGNDQRSAGNSGNGAESPKRHNHGRGKPKYIPRVPVDLIPADVRTNLSQYEFLGVEETSLIARRRGGPIEIVLRRHKFVLKTRSSSAQEPCTDPANPPTKPLDAHETSVDPSDVCCTPTDPAFKSSPFVDGALVWYTPNSEAAEPFDQVLIGQLPERPIDKGMPDASLLAHSIVDKLDFHMPYYRQETEFERFKIPISRTNLCRWHFEAGQLAEPIALAMWKEALERPWFAMDATSTAIFDSPKYRKGHIFVLVAPGDSVLFRYAARYNGKTVNELFGGTEAIIVADASSCHNLVFGPGRCKGSGCWSHARKPFVQAFQAGEKELAAIGLQHIRELFRIEDQIGLLSSEEKLRIRTEKSAPIVESFYKYVHEHQGRVAYESLMRSAFVYAINQEQMLRRFLSDGNLPISNNASERALRMVVKGRANWLHMRSDDHAEHTCALYSLIASCRQHDMDPEFYLQEVLTVAPSWPRSRVLELSPKYWIHTRQRLIADGLLRYIDLGAITAGRLKYRPS